MRVDMAPVRSTFSPPFQAMSTTETKQQTPTPAEIPFTQPQAMIRYVTDTGKILPRKYTGLSAKHQRAVNGLNVLAGQTAFVVHAAIEVYRANKLFKRRRL